MGVLEWLGAHVLGPLVSIYRTVVARPRPDVRILELKATGGDTFIDFSAFIQNYGTKPCRCGITASVGDRPVDCTPAIIDLLVSDPPKRIVIHIPRPERGDLVKAFDDETTLYGAELVVQVNDGRRMTSKKWVEHVYTPDENRERHDIQQRLWRVDAGPPANRRPGRSVRP
jgi:hypothetical protein